jgi:prevent-host-death family protein
MTKQLNLYEAKTRLSQLVEAAARGEDVIIAKNGQPLALLTRAPTKRHKREAGFLKGKVKRLSDKEWAALDREIGRDFDRALRQDDA